MEFLLQLFADLIGPPVEEEETLQENMKESEIKPQTEIVQDEEYISEEQILFELMQFH